MLEALKNIFYISPTWILTGLGPMDWRQLPTARPGHPPSPEEAEALGRRMTEAEAEAGPRPAPAPEALAALEEARTAAPDLGDLGPEEILSLVREALRLQARTVALLERLTAWIAAGGGKSE